MNNVIKVLFTGDFAPCKNYENLVVKKKESIFGDALPIIKSADFSFVNLECPLSNSENKILKSGPSLKASPLCIDSLKSFSVIGLANNHIMDYGEDGLKDTIDNCISISTPSVGAGLDLVKAQLPFIKNVKGLKIAVIAIAEHEFNQADLDNPGSAPTNPIDNFKQIQFAKKEADIVIVTLHGGNEYFPFPRPGLRKLCKYYVDLGVSAVICHHPHVPGAYEYYKNSPIIYSLGNLIFDSKKSSKDWDYGYMAELSFCLDSKDLKNLKLIPYEQSVKNRGIRLLVNREKEKFLDRIESYRLSLNDNDKYKYIWNNFVRSKTNSYLLRQYVPVNFNGIGFLSRKLNFLKLFINKKNVLKKLNMIRCQSHHELLVSILNKNVNK